MAYFSGEICSSVLQMHTSLQVILPQDKLADSEKRPCKVLYLLHGHTESAASWVRWTSIERYARDAGIAVVMPEVQRSWYADMAFGLPYFRYVTQELPLLCGRMFNISTAREDTYVAGQSMGGYGALRCALARPDIYAACASFSGSMDLAEVLEARADLKKEFQGIFGMDLSLIDANGILPSAEKTAMLPAQQRPRVLLTCGTEDRFLNQNRKISACLHKLDYDVDYSEWSGGHEWSFWDSSIKKTLPLLIGS